MHAYPFEKPLDPVAAIAALRRRGPVVALETTRPSDDHGRQTLVAGAPLATFTWRRGRGELEVLSKEGEFLRERWRERVEEANTDAGVSPFAAVEGLVDALAERVRPRVGTDPAGTPAPPLGAFGYFGYECSAPAEAPRLEPFPDAWFLLADTVVHWPEPGTSPTLWSAAGDLRREIEAARTEADRLVADAAPLRASDDVRDPDLFEPSDLGLAEYERSFAAARGALARGDSYQLCFTYPLVRRFAGDPLALHARLRRENPAPFSAFLAAPGFAIVSSSPERFLRVDREGVVEARPMKGTAARSPDPRERERAARELVASEKTRAENLMIADLLRNDLGRVCRLGSVRATRPALLEEHATVLQLVSVIEGRLESRRTRADLLASAFPPGSMTGAPKVRSIELLRELEREPRGPYSGALGYLATDGRMDLSVVIRSALLAGGSARVNVGGGLVWDSEASAEFAESRWKAAPLLRALRFPR